MKVKISGTNPSAVQPVQPAQKTQDKPKDSKQEQGKEKGKGENFDKKA